MPPAVCEGLYVSMILVTTYWFVGRLLREVSLLDMSGYYERQELNLIDVFDAQVVKL